MATSSDPGASAGQPSAWKLRADYLQVRAFAAHQREFAATGRAEGARVRAEGATIRAEAARVRDDGARTRDDAARVRDGAARVRDQAARARDLATQSRDEALRQRLLAGTSLDGAAWQKLLELDRAASDQSHEAATRDREAAGLDRVAADKDRDAAERDRAAAASDRLAADKDCEAAEKERQAADADRAAADSDRSESERELVRVEEHLTQAERLSVMGRLAAGIAHEINNPLATLLATLTSLQHLAQRDSVASGALVPVVDDARLSADRIAHVLGDMKAWLYEGAEHPARQVVDIDRLIKDSLRLTAADVEHAAKVVVDRQPTPPLWGVAARLGQVLTNLLLNAAHAISGPREKNEIRVTVRAFGQTVRLEVRDSGSGIAPDVLPHIFDPFFTTREGRGGTGLGLAMCQRIVAQHGGRLTVDSHLGGGSTFCVELPAGSESALQAVGAPAKAASGTKPRVLLIDDDEAFVRSMVLLLAERCEVDVARDGAEGLERLLAPGARYDVVLCDLMMPVMNGVQMYRRLSLVSPERAAQVVFVSGGATTDETAAFLASLPNVQLQKPFRLERLFSLIDERVSLQAR